MNGTSPKPADCQAICCANERCVTWVFVPSGLYPNRPQGNFCWLKAAFIPLKGSTCDNGKPGCISGVLNSPPPPSPPSPIPQISPDPKKIAKLVGDAFFAQSSPPKRTASGDVECPVVNGRACGMMKWGYGGALIFDGMFEAMTQFGVSEWEDEINKYLDLYLDLKSVPGYDLKRNITRPWDSA
eukprot:UC4_evm1s493